MKKKKESELDKLLRIASDREQDAGLRSEALERAKVLLGPQWGRYLQENGIDWVTSMWTRLNRLCEKVAN
jgi:hypothetical protein